MRVQTEKTVATTPQTLPPFAFSHPLVYAIRVQDRVEALDKFIHHELHPKLSRLREEHKSIEHQIQRTMTKSSDSVGTTRETKSKKLKQQAWLWKRTSKRQELNRFEPFFELATDLRKISKELNPELLRLTMLWQRSQSISPRKHLAADDSKDVVYNQTVIGEKRDRRRQREQKRLSRDYYNALMENTKLSKSIQKQTDKLRASKALNSNITEDAPILSSLMIFSYHYITCDTCEAKFHKDYMNALVVRNTSVGETKPCDSKTDSAYICIHCWNSKAQIQPKEQELETQSSQKFFSTNIHIISPMPSDKNDDQEKENATRTIPTPENVIKNTPFFETERYKARKLVLKNRMIAATATSNHGSLGAESSSNKISVISTPSADSSAAGHHIGLDFGSSPSETTSKIPQDSKNETSQAYTASSALDHLMGSMSFDQGSSLAENSSSADNNIVQDSMSETSRASTAVDHYIDSMSTFDDGLIRIGESLSSCSNILLGEFSQDDLRYNLPPLLQPLPPPAKSTQPRNIDMVRLQTKSPTIIDNYNNAQIERDSSERSDAWSRCGSTTSSLDTNSILESDRGDSLRSRNSTDTNTVGYRMDDSSRRDKTPLKISNAQSDTDTSERSDAWSRCNSPTPSLGTNSIVASDPEDSFHSRNTTDSNNVRYRMDESSVAGKTPLKRSNSSDSSTGSSIFSFSESSTERSKFSFLSSSSSEHLRPKSIKSAMKKTSAASTSSSTNGTSPTKVQDFPSAPLHKSVRFQSPLEECRVFDPLLADSHRRKALLNTSAEIMDQFDYFCKWDSFMNAFDQKSS